MFRNCISKLTTAEEAVKIVKSGDFGWITVGAAISLSLWTRLWLPRKDELFDVKIHGGVTMWMPEVCKADDAGDRFTWNSWHQRHGSQDHRQGHGLFLAPCAILNCPVSIGTATPPRMWL